ncbi:hypothetical protein ACQP2T_05265 [Nonomuraea sp. CA-143628]|uniref:hypothetical protein n=1 Tax=Nonomuraea sp. CA-143628 TaxID=3239997 RepID=UPI003D924DB6
MAFSGELTTPTGMPPPFLTSCTPYAPRPPVAPHSSTTPALIMNAQASEKQDPKALWGDPIRDRRVWAANDPVALASRLRGVSIYMSSGTNSFMGSLDPPGSPWHPAHLGEPSPPTRSKP